MRRVRWRLPHGVHASEPEPMYPELVTDPPEECEVEVDGWDDEVDEEYHGGTGIVAGDFQGPRIPRRGTPPVAVKPKRAWAEQGGALERVLVDALGLPVTYRQVIADSLRAHVTGARIRDKRADATFGDVAREWLTGRD